MNLRQTTLIAPLFAALLASSAKTADADPAPTLASVSSPALSAGAIRTFHDLGLREKIPAMREALRDRDENVRIAAIVALSQFGDDESRAAFQAAALSDSPRSRVAGREALYRLDSLERFFPYPQQTLENLARALKHERATVRHEAAAALLRYGAKAGACMGELNDALSKLDASCRLDQVLAYLEVLRQIGADAGSAGPLISEMMDERSKLFSNRDMHEVYRLRAHLMLTLADIKQARLGVRTIVDMLANSNQEVDRNFAAAAYATASLGSGASELAPLLSRALRVDFKDAMPLAASHGSSNIPTITSSGRIEAIRALAKIGPGAAGAVPLLEALLKTDPDPESNLPPWKADAEKALAAITKIGAK